MQQIYAILGDPVAQAQSPGVFNARARAAGVDALMVPLHVGDRDFGALVDAFSRARNVGGLVITIPHKRAAYLAVDSHGPHAAVAGVVNVIRRTGDGLHGELFDGVGLVRGLSAQGIQVGNKACLVVGAGGAGSAVAFALAAAGAADVGVSDTDSPRATDLVHRLRSAGLRAHAGDGPVGRYGIVVNCTPLGLNPGDPTPVDVDALDAGCVVADAVMRGGDTPLLQAALARGLTGVAGEAMLEGQMDLIWEFFGLPVEPAQPGDNGVEASHE